MVNTKDISEYIDKTYVSKDPEKYYKPLCNLANMPKITISKNAYDFDKIKEDINSSARSCDALYIGKWLNFIEFKQGFSEPIESEKYKLKKENMQLSIHLKACHSLQIYNVKDESKIAQKERVIMKYLWLLIKFNEACRVIKEELLQIDYQLKINEKILKLEINCGKNK